MFDAVFIDADNTLFDFDRTEEKALAASLSAFQLPADAESYQVYQRINEACWASYHAGEIRNQSINPLRWSQWLSAVGRGEVNADELAEHYAESLAQQCEKETGAEELMQYLTAKIPVHVITNGFPTSQAHRWRKAGWDKLLHGITVSAVVGVQKPDAEIFSLAMKAVGVSDPARCLMVGDNLIADVQGPQAIGMKGCWYRRKGATNQTDIRPDYEVTSLTQITQLL